MNTVLMLLTMCAEGQLVDCLAHLSLPVLVAVAAWAAILLVILLGRAITKLFNHLYRNF